MSLVVTPHTTITPSLNKHAAETQRRARRELHFAGGVETLANVFQPITEQFVYGFIAQDVIALWVPRIINALRRGREPYNPAEDPSVRAERPFQQWLHSIYMNAKGLNYTNATEETLREVETGPGLLIAQSVLYGAATAFMLGKLALVMGYSDLKAFKNTYVNMLKAPDMPNLLATSSTMKRAAFERNILHRFMAGLLMDGHFKSGLREKLPIEHITNGTQDDKALIQLLQKAFPDRELTRLTYKDVLGAWSTKWSELIVKPHKFADKGYLKHSDELESVLNRLVYWFNDNAGNLRQGVKPAKLNIMHVPQLGQHSETSVSHFVENSRKFATFIRDSIGMTRKKALNGAISGTGASLQKSLIQASEKLLKSSAISKMGLSLLATVFAGITVITVSAMAQRGKTYPANRNLMLNNINPGGNPHFGNTERLQAMPGGFRP